MSYILSFGTGPHLHMEVPRDKGNQINEAPRYGSLTDYLRVIRQERLLIALFFVIFGVAAFAYSFSQTPTYTATAVTSFHDPVEDLNLLSGIAVPATNPPGTVALINARVVTRRDVVRAVKEDLDSPLSPDALSGLVSVQVETSTFLVNISAKSDSPDEAARIANAFARAATRAVQRDEASFFDNAIRAATRQENGVRGGISAEIAAQERLQQLRTARDVIRPAQIERLATAPTQPSSPRIGRNTVLGALVGLILGIIASFFRDSLDRRLHSSSQVYAEIGVPILGKIGEKALGQTAFSSNAVNAKELDPQDLEAFRMLRTNLEFLKEGDGEGDGELKSVLITSGLSEEGKSTVASSLAAASALAGKRTLLIECDLRRPSLAERFGLSKAPGMTEYLTGRASPQETLQMVPLTKLGREDHENSASGQQNGSLLVCITAGRPVPHPAELLGSPKVGDFLEEVTKAYDLVIIDTSPLLSVVDALEMVPMVDSVLVCVRVAQTTREELRATKAALDHLPERPTGLVITGIRKGEHDAYGYYYGYGERDR